jgi:hypothetical protein
MSPSAPTILGALDHVVHELRGTVGSLEPFNEGTGNVAAEPLRRAFLFSRWLRARLDSV